MRALHQAAGVQHQSQGQQRAVVALLFRAAPPGLGLGLGLAFEIGVGEVDQGDRGLPPEQPHGAREEPALQGLALLQQAVVGAVQGAQAERFEIAAEQFVQAAALTQPDPGGALGSRGGHAPDQQRQRGLALRSRQAQLGQQGRQAELLGRPQGGLFDADRARPGQLQRVHVDALEIGPGGAGALGGRRGRGLGQRDAVLQQAGRDALGFGLDLGRAGPRHEFLLGVEDLAHAQAQCAPVLLGDGELTAEVEQGALADLGAVALGAHEAEGEVVLAVAGAGASAADEHRTKGARGGREVNPTLIFYGTTFRLASWLANEIKDIRGGSAPSRSNSVAIYPNLDEDGLESILILHVSLDGYLHPRPSVTQILPK